MSLETKGRASTFANTQSIDLKKALKSHYVMVLTVTGMFPRLTTVKLKVNVGGHSPTSSYVPSGFGRHAERFAGVSSNERKPFRI